MNSIPSLEQFEGRIFYFKAEETSMTAYVIVDINVTDPVRYEEYKKLAAPTVELYGGKYIARGGKTETLEGDWSPTRLVILPFEDIEQAKSWHNSVELVKRKACVTRPLFQKWL